MRPTIDLPDYETPFYLFGNAPPPRAARSLLHLVTTELLTQDQARTLIALAQRRASLVVVAPEASCGKSSLLSALLTYLPDDADRYFLRGSYETFRFARNPAWRPGRAVLIANEISDFLPVYVPGHLARRLVRLVGAGASLWATAHARGRDELLAGWPIWPSNAPLAVVSIGGDRSVATVEMNEPAHGLSTTIEAGTAIDSVCHAEGRTGSGTNALPVRVPAPGLRRC